MRTRPVKTKPLFVDPNAEVFATDDGEQVDNSEIGGLTGSTFIIGGESAKKRKISETAVLQSGAASADAILYKASTADDDLLPLLPLSRDVPVDESESDEELDDLLAIVSHDAEGDNQDDTEQAEEPKPRKVRQKAAAKEPTPDYGLAAEDEYTFPYSKSVLEILPDMPGTFGVRLVYRRGKTSTALFQTTAMRSIAEIRCRGQHFPVFLLQHARKKRDRIVLGGKRKTSTSWRAAVRCGVVLTGHSDRFTWFWRVTATAPALAVVVSKEAKDRSPEAVRLHLPFAPGKPKLFTIPGAEGRGIAVLMNSVAVSIVAQPQSGSVPLITSDESGVYLSLENANLSGDGTTLSWETWVSPAKTEVDAVSALALHLADSADRSQLRPAKPAPFLRQLMEVAEREVCRSDIFERRGADKNTYRIGPHRADVLLIGPGADAALTALAIYSRYLFTGDDMLIRRVRLLANGVCEFQNNIENSPHWGAMFDALVRKTEWGDLDGKRTISFTTTARTARGLQILQSYLKVDLYERTALGAAQWLLLRLDRDGLPQGERFAWDGKPIRPASPWLAGEALLPLVATFRTTRNEIYFKTALRIVSTLQQRFDTFSLTFDTASTTQLAALAEGVLLVSREYEQPELVSFARQMGQAIRSRRLADGSISDPTALSPPIQEDMPLLASTVAGARAALALARIDEPVLWTVFALRAARSAVEMLKGYAGYLNVADRASLLSLGMSVLLSIAARVDGATADYDHMTLKRDWQTFAPDPATAEYISVSQPNGDSPDYLCLVCPVSHQVLIAVYAGPDTTEVTVVKNGKRPFLKNLLNGDFSQTATLQPLEPTRAEGNIGVFLADT